MNIRPTNRVGLSKAPDRDGQIARDYRSRLLDHVWV